MYLNHLCTDRELIEAAQYAENPHLRLLAERLDDKLVIIQRAKGKFNDAVSIDMSDEMEAFLDQLMDILTEES